MIRDGDSVEPGTTTPVEQRAVIAATGGSVQTVTATVTSTPAVTDGGSDPGVLELVEVHADAEGDDRENLNDEYVVFENTGNSELDLSGWTIEDAADHVYTIPEGATLESGAQITVHTGSGSDTDSDLYWGASAPVWNNGGDTVTVRTEDGTIVLQEEYN